MTVSEAVRLAVAGICFAIGTVLLVAGGVLSGVACIGVAVALFWRLYRSW